MLLGFFETFISLNTHTHTATHPPTFIGNTEGEETSQSYHIRKTDKLLLGFFKTFISLKAHTNISPERHTHTHTHTDFPRKRLER